MIVVNNIKKSTTIRLRGLRTQKIATSAHLSQEVDLIFVHLIWTQQPTFLVNYDKIGVWWWDTRCSSPFRHTLLEEQPLLAIQWNAVVHSTKDSPQTNNGPSVLKEARSANSKTWWMTRDTRWVNVFVCARLSAWNTGARFKKSPSRNASPLSQMVSQITVAWRFARLS